MSLASPKGLFLGLFSLGIRGNPRPEVSMVGGVYGCGVPLKGC